MVAAVRKLQNPVDALGAVQELLLDTGLGVDNAAVNNAAGVTYTPAQMLGGLIQRSGAVTVSDTTPTAALLIAAMGNPPDGASKLLTIRNANTGALTLIAGSGVTLVGTTTIPTVNTRIYVLTKTGAAAVSLTGVMVAPF